MKRVSVTLLIILILATLASSLVVWRIFIYTPKPVPAMPTPIPPFFSLSPTPTLFKPVPEGWGDSSQELAQELIKKFPLYPYLPYQTSLFKIDYSAPLKLKVILKTAKTPAIEQEVFDWILSKRVEPTSHQIEWVVIPES